MLRVFLPGYDPAKLSVPPRIQAALDFFRSAGTIEVIGLNSTKS
jgi:hypothetical protein